MTTALDIITGALRLGNIVATGETAKASQTADALSALNDLLADWSTQSLLVFSPTQETYTVSSSITSLTIGPTGDKVTARPLRLQNLFLRVSSNDYPIELIDSAQYRDIPYKSLTGSYPTRAYYDPSLTNGTLYLWPGAISGQVLYWESIQILQSFASLATVALLPPNYLRALRFNLCVELMPEYEKEASPTVQRIAATSKRAIKNINADIPKLVNETASLSNKSPRSNIFLG